MTAPDVVLGVDVGQSSVRASAVDKVGTAIARACRDHPVRVRAGRASHDVTAWRDAMVTVIREVLDQTPDRRVTGIAVGALGPAPVLLDRELEPVAPALLYRLDVRAEKQRDVLSRRCPPAQRKLTHDHAAPKLAWWRERRPQVWREVHHITDVTGFLVASLVGRPVMDSVTWAQYYELPGLPPDPRLPEPASATDIAGEVTQDAARVTGLPPGVPVLVGSIDSYVDIFAAGVTGPGDAAVLCGSTGVVAATISAEVGSSATGLHLGSGRLVADWTGATGAVLDWATRVLAGGPSLVTAAAALPVCSDNILALTSLAPDADQVAAGAVMGLRLDTTAADLYRALVDGAAVDLAQRGRRIAAVAKPAMPWHGWGGGFADPLLARALVNALGQPVALRGSPGQVVGAAELARRILLGGDALAVTEVLHPDATQRAAYDTLAVRAADFARRLRNDRDAVTGASIEEG